jgi:hypothetical protein
MHLATQLAVPSIQLRHLCLQTTIHIFVTRDKINSYQQCRTEYFLITRLKESQEYPLAMSLGEKGGYGVSYKH